MGQEALTCKYDCIQLTTSKKDMYIYINIYESKMHRAQIKMERGVKKKGPEHSQMNDAFMRCKQPA